MSAYSIVGRIFPRAVRSVSYTHLSQAQRYVYIYTPYLAVGEEMLDALKNAAKRGVDVRLILPLSLIHI